MVGGIHFKILSNAGVEKKKNRTISVQYISMSYSKVGRGGYPECAENKYYYLIGNEMNAEYLCNGVEGYTSICGHRNTVNHKIWKNEKGNLIMCDCGCGFRNGKLGCLCLETKEEFYV